MKKKKPNYQIYFVQPYEVETWRGAIEYALKKSSEVWEDFTDMEDIFDSLHDGSLQYWMILDGETVHLSFMTQVQRNAIQVTWGYGELNKDILDLCHAGTQRFGLMQGVEWVEVHGREGFVRKFREWGFKLQKIVVSRRVEAHEKVN